MIRCNPIRRRDRHDRAIIPPPGSAIDVGGTHVKMMHSPRSEKREFASGAELTALFLGLGTGLGSAMIVEGNLQPMELAHLEYKRGQTFEDYLGLQGLERRGPKKWREAVAAVVERLSAALEPDYVVIGGGNAEKARTLPPKCRLGDNDNAFKGGFRLWEKSKHRD